MHFNVLYITFIPATSATMEIYHSIISIGEMGTQFNPAADLTVCPQSVNSQKQPDFISEKKNDI